MVRFHVQPQRLFDGRVVVDFDQVPIGIFKVDLFYAINAYRRLFSSARPVCILHIVFVEIGNEGIDVFYTEAQVIVPVALIFLFLTLDEVKVSGLTDGEPGVFAVVKGLRYLFQAKDVFVELRARFEIRHVNTNVI